MPRIKTSQVLLRFTPSEKENLTRQAAEARMNMSQYTAAKGVYTDTTKTPRSQRTLKFPKHILDLLSEYRNAQDAHILHCGERWNGTDRLFTKWNGEPMYNGQPYSWFKEFCEKNDIPFRGIHCFRHSFASILVNQGVDIVSVSGALGHSAVSTTSNIYCHMLDEARARVSDAVSAALDKSMQKKTAEMC